MAAAGILAGRAFVELQLRRKNFTSGLRVVEQAAAKTFANITKLGAGMAGIGLGAAGAFTLAVSKASDLNEAINKTQTIFGGAAATVADFAKTSSNALGISRRAANDYASELGLILLKSGSTQAESAKMSVALVKLAADIASMNNISVDEAFTKLKAGLVGSSEPLRSVGVLLSAAAVEARAAELGLEKVNGKFTEGAKVAARYALIMEQTKESQGDFAKTSGSLANVNRRVMASLENIGASVGQAVLPVYQRLGSAIAGIVDWVAKFVEQNKTLTQILFGVAVALTGVGTALVAVGVAGTTALASMSAMASVFAALTSPITLVGIGLAGIVAQTTVLIGLPIVGFFTVWINSSKQAWQLIDSLGNSLGNLLAIGKATFSGLTAAIQSGNWAMAGDIAMAGLKAAWFTGMEEIQNNWKTWAKLLYQSIKIALDNIRAYAKDVFNYFSAQLLQATQIAAQLASGNYAGAALLASQTVEFVSTGADSIADTLFGDIERKAAEARAELQRLVAEAQAANQAGDPILPGVPAPGESPSSEPKPDKAKVESTGIDFSFLTDYVRDLASDLIGASGLTAPQSPERQLQIGKVERGAGRVQEQVRQSKTTSTFVGAAAGGLGGITKLTREQSTKDMEKVEENTAATKDGIAQIREQISKLVQMVGIA